MSYYILIRGPLGIGKSTIAKSLAKTLKAKYFSMDDILSKNGLDKVSEEEGCIPAKNFIKADEIILPEAEKYLTSGNIIIFDGCFYHKEQISHLIENLPGEHYEFNLRASLETCIERDSKRKKSYGKDAAIAVYNAVSKFSYGIDILTDKKTEEQVVKEILSYLPK